jgi:preprotein translocase subunit SecG
MGVKQTTDVLEKGTWVFAALVGILCLVSPAFIPKDGNTNSKNRDLLNGVKVENSKPAATPANVPLPGAKVDSPAK